MTQNEYQVLARKYRPQLFSEVIGQEPIVATLKGAIAKKRTAHAYLFCGGRGSGKTTLARLFAKALNCSAPSSNFEPCNACSSCKEIASSSAIDVLEIDGASHRGIENAREINETIHYAPTVGRYKIYLIDEAHMLTKEAFNALLKVLEEPPERVKFFFATTEPHKIPPTILSRTQRFNLARIPLEKIIYKLEQITKDLGIEVEKEAAALIATLAEGSLRDAESLFDQVLAYNLENVTAKTVREVLGLLQQSALFVIDDAVVKQEIAPLFILVEEIFASGKNLLYFIEELRRHYRGYLLAKIGRPNFLSQDEKNQCAKVLPHFSENALLSMLEVLFDAESKLKQASSAKLALEMVLVQLLKAFRRQPLETLVAKLEALESGEIKSQIRTKDASKRPAEVRVTPEVRVSTEMRINPNVSVNTTIDPQPKKEELPPKKMASKTQPKTMSKPITTLSTQHKSHHDTLMRFAAKELDGSLKIKR